MQQQLQPGLSAEVQTTVTAEQTAQALGSGLVPVFGTPALIALLEAAAVKAIASYLDPGQTSVGIRLDVQHLAATPIGMAVRARAVLDAVEGRRLTFQVEAYDTVEQIAAGTHQRVIVDRERFVQRATTKDAK